MATAAVSELLVRRSDDRSASYIVSEVNPSTGTPPGIEDVGRGYTAWKEHSSQSRTTLALSADGGGWETPSAGARAVPAGARATQVAATRESESNMGARRGTCMVTSGRREVSHLPD